MDILIGLYYIFSFYPELLPTKVTLNLYQYTGDAPNLIASIKGFGAIDQNYKQTVITMQQQVLNHIRHKDLNELTCRKQKLRYLWNSKYFETLQLPIVEKYFDVDALVAEDNSRELPSPISVTDINTYESIVPKNVRQWMPALFCSSGNTRNHLGDDTARISSNSLEDLLTPNAVKSRFL
jgi:hypothetical protein